MNKIISNFFILFIFLYSNQLNAHPSSFADLVENLSPAVVSIASTTIIEITKDQYYNNNE